MTRNSRRLQKAVQAIFNDYREKASCPGQVYQNAACGCDNALQMWRGPKGEKGDTGPQGPKGDNAGSFLVDAEFVVDPEGQEPGAYLKLVLIDVAQQEQVVYVDLSYLTDIYEGGNGISIVDMVVAARLGAGLTFDANGNIASAYQFCDGLDETSNVVKVRLDSSDRILGFASGTCGGLTATVGLAPSATGVNLVLTGANGAVLSTIPLEGGTGITVQKNAQTGGFTWLADPAGLVSSQTGNQLSVSQTDNKLYVGGNTLEYTFGTGAFTLKDSSGATLSSVTVPSAVRMLEDMELRTDDGIYLHLTYLRDNGLHAYQDVSLDELLCNNVDTADDTSAAYSKAVPSGNWQIASINEIGGKTIAWNQLLDASAIEIATTESNQQIVGTFSGVSTHYYLISWTQSATLTSNTRNTPLLTGDGTSIYYNSGYNIGLQAGQYGWIVQPTTLATGTMTLKYWGHTPNVGYSVDDFMITDLTLMFGSGNEPTTVEQFRAMFPAAYYPYNAGELRSAGVTEVASRDANDVALAVLPIPSAIQSLPGYGWSAGSAYNYIDFERKVYVQRVSSVDLGTLTWHYSATAGHEVFYCSLSSIKPVPTENDKGQMLCMEYTIESQRNVYLRQNDKIISTSPVNNNPYRLWIYDSAKMSMTPAEFKASLSGIMLYYELATPIETDISEYLTNDNLINVEAGGTLTFKNQHGDDWRVPVPNSETFIYEHPWVFEDCVKDAMQPAIDALNARIDDVSVELTLDVHCTEIVTPGSREPYSNYYSLFVLYDGDPIASGYVNGGSTISGIIISDPSMVQSFALSAYVSSGSDGTNEYVLNASLTDLIAAGSDGLRFPLTQFQKLSGIPYDVPIWVSCEAGEDVDEYVFNIMTGVEERTDTELTADLLSGENRTDLKPLIEKVGGTVSERYTFEDRHIVYNCDIDVCGFDIDGDHEGPSGAVDVAYLDITVPAGGKVYLLIGDPDDSYNTVLTTFEEISVPIERIATETGLRLYNFDFSDYDGSAGLSSYFLFAAVVDEEYPNAELGSDEHIYRFTLKKAVETKQILCLEPSCDPCIDLSPALADTVRSIAPSFECVSRYSDSVLGTFYFYTSGGSLSGSAGFQATLGEQDIVYSSDAAYEVAINLYFHDGSTLCSYRSSRFNRADLSAGSLIPIDRIDLLIGSSTRFPAQVFLEVVSVTSSTLTYILRDPNVLYPQFTLTTVMTDGDESTETLDMSCILDTVDEKIAPVQEQVTQNASDIATLQTVVEGITTDYTYALGAAVSAYYDTRRTGKVYQVKFPTWDTAHTVAGEKLLDNAGLVCVPSTDTVEGQDDYADIPMFQWVNVNYARNADGSPYPTAIEGSNAYKTTGSVDVGAMQMSFYYRVHVENGYQYWTVSDSPHPELNLVPWPECVKADGTVLPWCIGSKYMAGRAPDGTPRSLPGLDLWNRDMSYNNAVTYFHRKGAGYQGAGMEAGLFNLLFMVIKYATKNLNTIMYGCLYYTYYGYVALAETDATRILLPANDAQFLPNTYIQSGTSTVANRDRGYADAYDVCDHAKILSVEQVTVGGTTYTALNIDKTVTTTLGGVVITTPFNAGATDSVLGHHDGSPVDNNSGHWPCRVQGREQFVGAWCLSCDVALNTVTSLDQEIWWAPKGVTRSTNTTVIQDTYRNIGTAIGNSGTNFWIGDIDVYNGEGLWVPSKVGQSNSTGWCDHRWVSTGVGWREHLWGGPLSSGTAYGPVAWDAPNALSNANWNYAARD